MRRNYEITKKLQIVSKYLYTWEKRDICNDCDNESNYMVKYPKLKPIQVCNKCFNKYYKELLWERSEESL